MPNPRNVVEFEGIDSTYATYKIDASTIVYDGTKARGAATTMLDKAVSLSADDTIQLCADAQEVIGRLESVEADNKASVQVEGFTNFPAGLAAAVGRGQKIIGATGTAGARGYIRAVGTASAELDKGRGRIIRNTDTAAVVVQL